MERRTKANLLRTCGVLAWIGSAAVLITNVVGVIVVDGHNPIADTISQLAVGKHAWIQDLGLNLLGLAFLACGIGLLVFRKAGARSTLVAVACILLAIDMVLIAEHNQYASDQRFGGTVHSYATIALWVLFVLAAILLAFGMGAFRGGRMRWASLAAGLLWIPLPPLFLYLSRHATSWDGLLERFLGVVLVLWVSMLGWLLFGRGVDAASPARRAHA